MLGSKRAIALASACAVALALVPAGIAQADDPDPVTLSRAGAGVARESIDNELFAGYVSDLGQEKTIKGSFIVPTLECRARVEGIVSIIEIASAGGAQYADGAVYSYCLAGLPIHTPVFDTDRDQFPIIETVRDADRIRVKSLVRPDGTIRIKVKNVTRGWSAVKRVPAIPAEEASSLQYRFELGDGIMLPPYDYGTLPVRRVLIGGKELARTDPLKFNLVIDERPIITPGKIEGSDFEYSFVG